MVVIFLTCDTTACGHTFIFIVRAITWYYRWLLTLVFAHCELLEGRDWVEIIFIVTGPGTE